MSHTTPEALVAHTAVPAWAQDTVATPGYPHVNAGDDTYDLMDRNGNHVGCMYNDASGYQFVQDVWTQDLDEACATVDDLLAAHKQESDHAAKPLAKALREQGEIVAEKGTPGQDYTGLIKWHGMTWLAEENNASTRIYDPCDADYDYRAELNID